MATSIASIYAFATLLAATGALIAQSQPDDCRFEGAH